MDDTRKSALMSKWWNESVDLPLDCIIFDIDGTLANVSHRRKHVVGSNKDWKAWNDNMGGDSPYMDVCFLAELLGDHPLVNNGSVKLFIFSGRGEEKRDVTVAQLENWIRPYFKKCELHMRAEGDYRSDVIVKREFLQAIRKRGYEPRIVVDDRPSVCAMWREEGLTVLQHDSGEWDDAVKTWGPGRLVMLVGPSGGGKTTYALQKWPAHEIVASDQLRSYIAGDFRDQSKNDQVFYALHRLVEARVKSGLLTVVDATNLRSRDRKALRDLVPADGNIYYHVIDRPLAEKHRDAGWRDYVMVKRRQSTGDGEAVYVDVKLIDKHHQSFQSAKKLILRGDDDSRVTVIDSRAL